MIITDTHTHLYSEVFNEDRTEVIERALAAGVTRFFIPAIDSTYTESMYALEKSYPENMFLMMGLHPTHVKEDYLEELNHVKQQLKSRKFVAIGEIQLAKHYKLPIVIHCRGAFDQVFEILEEEKGADLHGIFHCFTGTFEQAQQAISYNMKLGIGGVATFVNGRIDKFLKRIDLKHIVLETDSPYLSPVPNRGKRNESSFIVNVLDKLSTIYRMSKEDIAAITTQNSKDVFKR